MHKIFAYFLFFLMLAQPVFAHPPSSIEIQYDKAKNEIVADIYHRISTARHEKNRTHFIKEVTLKINGEQVDSKTFYYQNNPNIVIVRFSMPKHENSDNLAIKAICSTGSELTREAAMSSLPDYQQTKEDDRE